MGAFLHDASQYAFLQYALAAAVLASVAAGTVGSYVVARRTTYTAGAISHCLLGGMGAARYFQRVHGVAWLTPMHGAVAAALLAALLIGGLNARGRHRGDTVLSAVWALGMAVGVSFMAATPGYHEDLMSYLFGNILMVTPGDLGLMAALDAAIVVCVLLVHDRFLVIGFNPELARLRGLCVGWYESLLLILTALTVVLLVKVVGVVLAIALLSLPPAAAGLFTRRLGTMMIGGVAVALVVTVGGLALSYAPDWPAGATIAELAGLVYLLAAGARRLPVFRGG